MALELFVSVEYIEAVLDVDEFLIYEKASSHSGVKAVVVDHMAKKNVIEGSVAECLDFMETMDFSEQYDIKIDLISLSDAGITELSFRPTLGPNESVIVESGRVVVVENKFGWVVYLVDLAGPSKVLCITDLVNLKRLSKSQLEELFSHKAVVGTLSDLHRLKRFSMIKQIVSKKISQKDSTRFEGLFADHSEISSKLDNRLIEIYALHILNREV